MVGLATCLYVALYLDQDTSDQKNHRVGVHIVAPLLTVVHESNQRGIWMPAIVVALLS